MKIAVAALSLGGPVLHKDNSDSHKVTYIHGNLDSLMAQSLLRRSSSIG